MKLSRSISIGLIVVSVLASLALIWSLAAIPAAQAAAPVQNAAGGLVSSCDEMSLLAALAGGGTVTFDTTGECVITVSETILMTAPTTIDGNGHDVTLSGGDARRIISATAGVVSVTLQNITLTRGFAPGVDQNGGAVYVGGNLVLSNTAIISNTAGRQGGGAYITGTLTLNNSRVLNNRAGNSGGGVRVERRAILNGSLFQNNASARNGGGLFAAGLTSLAALTNTRFVSNTADDRGGGMYANGPAALNGTQFFSNTSGDGGGLFTLHNTLNLTSGVFQGNEASHSGGGVYYDTSVAVITGVQFISNVALSAGGGGAIYNTAGTVTLLNSTLIRNTAPSGLGGGINNDNGSTLTVQNSTFSGNRAILGGAISTIAVLTLTNSTLARNPSTGALYIGISGMARLYNSIIANDPAGGTACVNDGTIAINVRNLTRDGTCNPALSGDPLLGTLGNYGGSLPTVPLLPGSPAIDAGDAGACLARDQRGVARLQGSACDLGAFESRGFTLSGTGGDNQSTPIDTPFPIPLALTVSSSFAEPVNGGQVKFTAPAGGASTNPTIYTATIAGGAAALSVTANGVVGSYVVTATAQGAAPNVTYALTNIDAAISGLKAINDSPTQLGNATHLTTTIATGSNVMYAWDLGDNNLAASKNVTYTYASLGTYTATVTATNSLGHEITTTVVRIVDVPITGLTVSNDSPTRVGSITHFTATIATGASVVYDWNFGDGSSPVVGAGQQLTHTYPAVGPYTATITARNSTYTQVITSRVTVVEIPITGLVAHNDSPTRVNTTTHFSATITTGSNPTYNWNFGDGTPVAVGAGQQPTHVYKIANTYIASVTVTNTAYTQVATTTVTVVPYRIMLPLVMKQQ